VLNGDVIMVSLQDIIVFKDNYNAKCLVSFSE